MKRTVQTDRALGVVVGGGLWRNHCPKRPLPDDLGSTIHLVVHGRSLRSHNLAAWRRVWSSRKWLDGSFSFPLPHMSACPLPTGPLRVAPICAGSTVDGRVRSRPARVP